MAIGVFFLMMATFESNGRHCYLIKFYAFVLSSDQARMAIAEVGLNEKSSGRLGSIAKVKSRGELTSEP
jgi:hypothetical protein